ncbi:NUDIX hydrolase [Robertkochia solimangrovi]|uniref:NUDIX hydrolase n=1 Tax=Robertkochia solimangrovi TaxID=2213046 RepID=UPI00117EEA69|nr:NUDIX domain-containing protein [Robertkochia solimangrovi]TRZ45746.1 NUDIX hydrolase [Robertkochia solimangrovi]
MSFKSEQHIKVAVDAVVFGYIQNHLQILLTKQNHGSGIPKWALPGGFVKDNESVECAVSRELQEETGVNVNYLEQLFTFGSVDRDHRGRVVSVAYLALINPRHFILCTSREDMETEWFNLDEIPDLAYDHKEIIEKGWERLKAKINYQPVGFELLKREFPFSDLENLYQTILNKKIDRRNFRKKIMSYDLLLETDKIYQPKSGRPAKLYKFNHRKYRKLEKDGFHFEVKFA